MEEPLALTATAASQQKLSTLLQDNLQSASEQKSTQLIGAMHQSPLSHMLEQLGVHNCTGEDFLPVLCEAVIGSHVVAHDLPFGPRLLTYADWTASGRSLRFIEDYIAQQVLPVYANTHTDVSYTGARMTLLREGARQRIANAIGAPQDSYATIFTGSGCTAAINLFLRALNVRKRWLISKQAVIFIGPYEHNSNFLPWVESGATVVRIPEALSGGPDLEVLELQLKTYAGRKLKIGSFSAASNVTGTLANIPPLSNLLHRHGALSCIDYASGAPYLDLNLARDEVDAAFISPHKFVGGPGTPGLLVVRRDVLRLSKARRAAPSNPGGGAVDFVTYSQRQYLACGLEEREEAGTPDIIGSIRAGLVFDVKAQVGAEVIAQREEELNALAILALSHAPGVRLLGDMTFSRLPIFSFVVEDKAGEVVHHDLVCMMLNDLFGVQARSGCACANGYSLRVLDLNTKMIQASNLHANYTTFPGFVRVSLPYFVDKLSAQHILDSIKYIAMNVDKLRLLYKCQDSKWRPVGPITQLGKLNQNIKAANLIQSDSCYPDERYQQLQDSFNVANQLILQ